MIYRKNLRVRLNRNKDPDSDEYVFCENLTYLVCGPWHHLSFVYQDSIGKKHIFIDERRDPDVFLETPSIPWGAELYLLKSLSRVTLTIRNLENRINKSEIISTSNGKSINK